MNIPLAVRYQVLGTGWKSHQGTFQVSLAPQPAWSSAQKCVLLQGWHRTGTCTSVPGDRQTTALAGQQAPLKPTPVCSGPDEGSLLLPLHLIQHLLELHPAPGSCCFPRGCSRSQEQLPWASPARPRNSQCQGSATLAAAIMTVGGHSARDIQVLLPTCPMG